MHESAARIRGDDADHAGMTFVERAADDRVRARADVLRVIRRASAGDERDQQQGSFAAVFTQVA
jgi:hypothetical protein